MLNAQLSNPAAGQTPTTRAPLALIATSDPFETARTQQWNVGVQRQLYKRGVIDIGYVGSTGDNLIQPVDINHAATPGRGDGSIPSIGPRPTPATARSTSARPPPRPAITASWSSFRHEGGRAGTLNLAYTLSRTKTDATNDRDAVDLPQNPLDLAAEYAIARTDRTHVFTANYVYELPFFKDAKGLLKATLGGWQVSGITQFWSGPPISRVVNGNTNGSRRGIRVNQVSDPFANLPADVIGGVYWFNPAAFASPGGRAATATPAARSSGSRASTSGTSRCRRTGTRARARVSSSGPTSSTPSTTPSSTRTTSRTPAAGDTATSCAASTGNFGQITGTRTRARSSSACG